MTRFMFAMTVLLSLFTIHACTTAPSNSPATVPATTQRMFPVIVPESVFLTRLVSADELFTQLLQEMHVAPPNARAVAILQEPLRASSAILPYGSPVNPLNSPRSNFYGTGGIVTAVVYIVNRSGSMMDHFDPLKSELKRSTGNLTPLHRFAIILFDGTDKEILGGKEELRRASRETRQEVTKEIDALHAGTGDAKTEPLLSAFKSAFALKPQLVYFLTDEGFDPELLQQLDELNKGKKIRVNTLAFVRKEPAYEQQLRTLAKNNGGVYRFISEKELDR